MPNCPHPQWVTVSEVEVEGSVQSEVLPNCPHPQWVTVLKVEVEGSVQSEVLPHCQHPQAVTGLWLMWSARLRHTREIFGEGCR